MQMYLLRIQQKRYHLFLEYMHSAYLYDKLGYNRLYIYFLKRWVRNKEFVKQENVKIPLKRQHFFNECTRNFLHKFSKKK